jgi:hypothetical protein
VLASHGDELIDRLCAGENDSSANDLLTELFRGYPVESLRRLLRSDEEPAVKAGAWILSELGVRAAPMMTDIVALLGHPLRYVRFFAVDAVLAAATAEDGAAVAAAIELTDDPDDAVRWKVLTFLAWASAEQLAAGVEHLRPPLRDRTEWLARAGSGAVAGSDVLAALDGPDRLARLFAAAATVRLAGRDRDLLRHAAASSDAEVSSFAQEQLESGRLPSE